MKKKLTQFGIIILMITTATLFAVAQPHGNGKGKGQDKHDKKEKENNGKGQDKKDVSVSSDVDINGHNGKDKDKKDKKDKHDNGNNGNNGNNGKNDDRDRGRNDDISVSNDGNFDWSSFRWTPQTFRQRDKFKNQEKVTVCHKISNNDRNGVAINVSANALKAHLAHGDVRGGCPEVKDKRYSDTYVSRRTEYYNRLQRAQEQVLYSKSMLDYAKERLAQSRLELALMQKNRRPQPEIERRQRNTVELEQNVSVLESLIGVATTLVVNKLM